MTAFTTHTTPLLDSITPAALLASLDSREVSLQHKEAAIRHALNAAQRDGRDADADVLAIALTDPRRFPSPAN